MKKQIFIALFISAHLFFVFSQIHKQSAFIKLSYEKQNYEKLKQELSERRQALNFALRREINNPASIKSCVTKKLQMQKIALNQIKSLPHEQPV